MVMLPASCHQIFISLYLKDFLQNLVQNCTVVSEKIRFNIIFACTRHWTNVKNELDLQYSLTLMNKIRCLRLTTLRSLAAIVSEKIYSFHFFQVTKFDLAVK